MNAMKIVMLLSITSTVLLEASRKVVDIGGKGEGSLAHETDQGVVVKQIMENNKVLQEQVSSLKQQLADLKESAIASEGSDQESDTEDKDLEERDLEEDAVGNNATTEASVSSAQSRTQKQIPGYVQIFNYETAEITGYTIMHHRFNNDPIKVFEYGALKGNPVVATWRDYRRHTRRQELMDYRHAVLRNYHHGVDSGARWVSSWKRFNSETWTLHDDWWSLSWQFEGDCNLYQTIPNNGIEQFFKNPDNWRYALEATSKVVGYTVGGIPGAIVSLIHSAVEKWADKNGYKKNDKDGDTQGLFSLEIRKPNDLIAMLVTQHEVLVESTSHHQIAIPVARLPVFCSEELQNPFVY